MKWILHLSGYSDWKPEKYLQLQEFSTLDFGKKSSSYDSCTHTHKSTEIFHLKKKKILKEFMFGRDRICFTEQNKNYLFLLNVSLTALYRLSQSLTLTGLRVSHFPLPPAVRLLVMQPSTATQSNVIRREICTNFPVKGNRRHK